MRSILSSDKRLVVTIETEFSTFKGLWGRLKERPFCAVALRSATREFLGGFLVYERILLCKGCTFDAAGIGRVFVPREHREQGYATRLLWDGMPEVKSVRMGRPFSVALLHSGDRSLYSRCGFKVIKRCVRKDEHLWLFPFCPGMTFLETQDWEVVPRSHF